MVTIIEKNIAKKSNEPVEAAFFVEPEEDETIDEDDDGSAQPPSASAESEEIQEITMHLPVLIEIDKHVVYKIDKPLMSIGNSEQDDIFIDGLFISDEHVIIERTDEETVIYSKKLMGRFKVNGKKTARHTLQHKDKIEIGSNTFRYMEHGKKQ
ncbi:MAG: FHA domain-containing protein, partial [Chitinivibrionales bacterium]|nr:FHA domain-containing protein [Chitinivibrionales bacterium]